MGLSRNKVAVSEGAAGSPPFYGEMEAHESDALILTGENPEEKTVVQFSRTEARESVIQTQRVHPFPFRTRKLSSAVLRVLCWRRHGRVGHGRHCSLRRGAKSERPAPKGRGCSSVGRAPALQAGGHGFESHHLHQAGDRGGKGFVRQGNLSRRRLFHGTRDRQPNNQWAHSSAG